MKTAILSSLVWLNKSDVKDINRLKNALTVIPKDLGFGVNGAIELYVERDGMIGVPRNFFFKNGGMNYEIIDKTNAPKVPEGRLLFNGELRDNQKVAVEPIMKLFNLPNFYGGIFCCPTGWGKTIFALYILSLLGLKALVVVHKEFLMNQWIERITGANNTHAFLPNARVGIIQQDRCDYKDVDIAIGMIHSLSQREYPQEVYDSFGVIVSDEVHRVSAPTWSMVIPKFSARYLIGISATPRRRDMTDKVFLYTIGDIVYKAKQDGLEPEIRIYRLPAGSYKGSFSYYPTFLARDFSRNQFIVSLIEKACSSDRKVIVLSDRLMQLKIFNKLLAKKKIFSDFYIGGRKQKDLVLAAKANVVLATYSMASEGLDISDLDTLILATPKSDVEQSVGRILRIQDGKKKPIVVDIADPSSIGSMLLDKRIKFYNSKGWSIYNVMVKKSIE